VKRLYLDASYIIYLVEASSSFHETAVSHFTGFRARDSAVITSELSRLECRIKPLRDHNEGLLRQYAEFFNKADLTVAPIDTRVIDRATDVRARYSLSTPDAIHAATAIELGADVLRS
jgi:predicted nucleic acid-binding protein